MNLLSFALLVALAAPAAAAESAAPGERIVGEWRGSSVCLHREQAPACRDEIVRYRFTATPGGPAAVHGVADKQVNGEYQTMGEMDFAYSASEERWTYPLESRTCPHCLWWFRVNGDELVGGLTDRTGVELRQVSARRYEE